MLQCLELQLHEVGRRRRTTDLCKSVFDVGVGVGARRVETKKLLFLQLVASEVSAAAAFPRPDPGMEGEEGSNSCLTAQVFFWACFFISSYFTTGGTETKRD